MIEKYCENCNMIHNGKFGSGRFCKKECAKSFSTKHHKKEISDKIKLKWKERISLKEMKKCISCNLISIRRKLKFCEECKKYSGYKILYFKLKIDESNFQIANKKALEILNKEYFLDKKSKTDIMKKYGLMSNTIYDFFKKNDIKLRTTSESLHNCFLDESKRLTHNIKENSKYQYKQGWHDTWNNEKAFYRSSHELEYFKKLDEEKIDYKVEKLRIKYFNSHKNKFCVSIPDIYLPDSNTIIEIKSNYTLNKINMIDKIKSYKELGYNFKLILNKKEENFENW